MSEKTHIEVKSPEIDTRHLADYMAGSERKKRAILIGCKYRPIVKLLQHKEARIVVANALRHGEKDAHALKDKAERVRAKLATDDFDALTNEANAEYIERFARVVAGIELPTAEIIAGKAFPAIPINGVKVRFSPQLLLRRLTRTNKVRNGAIMLRYAKGQPLSPLTGDFQSAIIFGVLVDMRDDESEPDKSLCLTLDVLTGTLYAAPGRAASMYANTKAACQSITEQWPNLPAPPGARL